MAARSRMKSDGDEARIGVAAVVVPLAGPLAGGAASEGAGGTGQSAAGADDGVAGEAADEGGAVPPDEAGEQDGTTLPPAPPGGEPSMSAFTHVVIARSGLLLRRGPGTEFPPLRSLPYGTKVRLLKREDRWGLVDVQGDAAADGFVHLAYLDELATGTGTGSSTVAGQDDDRFLPIDKALLQEIMDRCAGGKVKSKLDLDQVADALNRSMLKANANNRRREVGFLSQSVIETDFFRTFREYGGQTRPYAPFFGRGMHQLTHRETYAAASRALYDDDRLVRDPDLILNDIQVNIDATAWYWRDYKPFNSLADARDVDGIIYRLYGGKITSPNPKVRESVIRRRSYYKTIDGLLDQRSV